MITDMSLIYVTGVSGMGKSALFRELKLRGKEVYGVDEDVLGDWVNKSSGAVDDIDEAAKSPSFDIHDWYREHSWVLSEKRIAELADRAISSTTYLCGTAEGYDDCKRYFTKTYALYMGDSDELKARILARSDVDYGKHPRDMARILDWQRTAPEYYAAMGAIMLDASHPVSEIADQLERENER